MNTGYIKKIISSMMALLMMVCLSAMPVSAMTSKSVIDAALKVRASQLILEGEGIVADNKANMANVINDLFSMKKYGVDVEQLSIHEATDDGNIVYAYQMLDNYISFVDVTQEKDGSTTLHYVEGEKEDYLCYGSDGVIYLNGSAVTITHASEVKSPPITLMAGGFDHVTQTHCPPGTTVGQYSGIKTFYWNSKLDLVTTTIAGATLGAVASIFISSLWGAAVVMSTTVANFVVGGLISYAVSGSSTATSASYTDYRRALNPQDGLFPKYRHLVEWKLGASPTVDVTTHYYEVLEPR